MGVAITAYAGQNLSGAVATFNSPNTTGLASTINWGDGHVSAGILGGVDGRTFAIVGTNTFAQSGSYTLVISIDAPPGSVVTVKATATVLPPGRVSGTNLSMTPTLGSYNVDEGLPAGDPIAALSQSGATFGVTVSVGFTNNQTTPSTQPTPSQPSSSQPTPSQPVPGQPTASHTASNQASAVNTAAGQNLHHVHLVVGPAAQYSIALPQEEITGPPRTRTTDLITWSSTRDQGLNRPLEVSAIPGSPNGAEQTVAGDDISDAAAPASLPLATVQVIVRGPAATGANGLATTVDNSAGSSEGIPPQFITAASRTTSAAHAGRTAFPSRPDEPEEQETPTVYHQPLYRVADRGELGGLSGMPILSGNRHSGPGTPAEQNLEELGELALLSRVSRAQIGGGVASGDSLVEVAMVWAVFQALHASDMPLLPKPAALSTTPAHKAPLPPGTGA
jgi:hypothetical protein